MEATTTTGRPPLLDADGYPLDDEPRLSPEGEAALLLLDFAERVYFDRDDRDAFEERLAGAVIDGAATALDRACGDELRARREAWFRRLRAWRDDPCQYVSTDWHEAARLLLAIVGAPPTALADLLEDIAAEVDALALAAARVRQLIRPAAPVVRSPRETPICPGGLR